MRIGDRHIGQGRSAYIIAELGVNHDGSVARALELVDGAADAGADAVKLQFFKADVLMSRAAKLAAYQKSAGERDPIEMLRRLELTLEEFGEIIGRAHRRRLHAIVTVFSVELVDQAERLPWDAYKTASPDIIHTPLIERLARTGRPLILSTGAATMEESMLGLAAAEREGACGRIALLQCVSSYPTAREQAELGGIGALAGITRSPVGYSDHTADIDTGAAAARLGAAILEKHITYDRGAPGPDHAASLDPAEFRRYAAGARDARTGPWPESLARVKRVLPCESDVRRLSRQSLTTRTALKAGRSLGPEDFTFKRPGTGLPPWRIGQIYGSQLTRDVEADMPLTQEDLV